jgi:DNA mismatch repair ATPase MutS
VWLVLAALLLCVLGVMRRSRRERLALVRAAAAAGDVDAAISIASFRAGRADWTTPDFRGAGTTTELIELRHPLVDDAVPNSIVIRAGRGVLVTGSNMSGKSTFLRTVGVNAVLAQTISTALANEYRAPVIRRAQQHREGRRSAGW